MQKRGYPSIFNCYNITRFSKSPIHATRVWDTIRSIRFNEISTLRQSSRKK